MPESNARQAQIGQTPSLNQRISNQGKTHLSLTSNSISDVDTTTLALPSKRVAVPNRDGHMTESNARQAQIRQTSSLNQRISNQGKTHLSLTSNGISGVDTTTLALPSKRVAVPNRDGHMPESNARQAQIRQTSSLNQRISNQGKAHFSLTSNSISGVDTTTLALPSKRVAVPNRDGHMTESNARQAPTPEQLSLQQSNITNDTNTAIEQNDNNYIIFDNSASGQIRTSDQLKEMETKLKQREKALSKNRERCKENGN
jgi:microcystin-dependent protein